MLEAQRLAIMDDQRFDLSKRLRPCLSIQVTGSAVTDLTGVKSPPPSPSHPRTANIRIGGVWNHYDRVFVPAYTTSSSTSSNSDGDTTSAESDSPLDTPPTSAPEPAPLGDDGNPNGLRQTDVYDNGEFITTRTIVRPAPNIGIFSAFSRPSSPFSRPSSPCTSRPSSPVNIGLGSLSCFSSTQNFELDLDTAMQKEETQALQGIEVVVTKEVTVHREELWREAVQEVLYGQGQNYTRRRLGHAQGRNLVDGFD